MAKVKDTLVIEDYQKKQIHDRRVQIKHGANSASELVRMCIDEKLNKKK